MVLHIGSITPARPLSRAGEAKLEVVDQDGDGSIYCRGIPTRLAPATQPLCLEPKNLGGALIWKHIFPLMVNLSKRFSLSDKRARFSTLSGAEVLGEIVCFSTGILWICLYSLTSLMDNMTSRMDRLFGSKTRVSLLSKLLLNAERSFYIRELSRELDIPYGMLHKEVKNLVSLGVVVEEKKGKVTFVSVNKGLPYFAELKGLIVKTVGLADVLRKEFSGLKGVQYALVYGSFASGEETGRSDVDLLIVGDVTEEEVIKVVSRVEKDVGREINYVLWSEGELVKRVRSKHHLLMDIVSKPVIMVVGEEDEFRRAVKR